MSSYMKTTIYGKLHQNLRGAVHLLCQMRCIDRQMSLKERVHVYVHVQYVKITLAHFGKDVCVKLICKKIYIAMVSKTTEVIRMQYLMSKCNIAYEITNIQQCIYIPL